jgi:hypothetical protein
VIVSQYATRPEWPVTSFSDWCGEHPGLSARIESQRKPSNASDTQAPHEDTKIVELIRRGMSSRELPARLARAAGLRPDAFRRKALRIFAARNPKLYAQITPANPPDFPDCERHPGIRQLIWHADKFGFTPLEVTRE